MKPCKFGFYTCEFVGLVDFCNNCEDGDNYQMKEKKQDGRADNGGPRKGAGRPKKEPTVTISFRVMPKYVEPIKKAVNKIISKP